MITKNNIPKSLSKEKNLNIANKIAYISYISITFNFLKFNRILNAAIHLFDELLFIKLFQF